MKQSTALSILKSGRNVFLTGSAGAGKTYVLNQYIQYLRDRKVPVAITASTGIAATHINGMTIHAWSGIGVRNVLSQGVLNQLKEKKYLRDKMEKAKVLIIDEISMLHKIQLDLVNKVLKFFKENDEPFGGVQVIFSGDFFQLPPVGNPGESNRDKFAFMAKTWVEAQLAVCYLTEQHRQENDELTSILNEIRKGTVSPASIALLEAAKETELNSQWIPPKLFTHNNEVRATNLKQLRQLEGDAKRFTASTKGNQKLLEILKKSVRAKSELELKVGAKVMFVRNNFEEGYVNGTLGEVVDFDKEEGLPKVKTVDGRTLTVSREEWSMSDDTGKTLVSYTQFPLRLAWAITIHKSQGMTLDMAEMDLRFTFERGQGYVALSRVKSLDGLKLEGFNGAALEVDGLALKADKRFQELSQEAEDNAFASQKQLEQQAIQFIKKCGGITNPDEIKKHKKRAKEKKKKVKKSTFLITRELVDAGLSAEEIAEERGLTIGTILGHIIKIGELDQTIDLSLFRPKEAVMQRVFETHDTIAAEKDPAKLRDDGSVSSKAMYEAMNKEVDYKEIRLSLLFRDRK